MRAEKMKLEKGELFYNYDKKLPRNTFYLNKIKEAPIVVEMKKGNTILKIKNVRIKDAK